MGKAKKTVQNKVILEKKGIVPPPDVDIDGFTPPMGWNFRQMDQTKDFEWKCTYHRLTKYRDRLLSFEGKSFQQIEVEAGSNHAWKDVSKLNKNFRKAVEEKGIDLSDLWQLELDGKARLFGTRDGNIFVIRWLDTGHTIYRVEKKHT